MTNDAPAVLGDERVQRVSGLEVDEVRPRAEDLERAELAPVLVGNDVASSAGHLEVEGDGAELEGTFVESVGFVVVGAVEKLTTFRLIECFPGGGENLTQAELAETVFEKVVELLLSLLGKLGG
jgi:hypothetical protein